MIDDLQPLIDRLRTMYDHRGDGIPTQPVNPDGEKAIEAIERLSAENERLREELAQQADGCSVITGLLRTQSGAVAASLIAMLTFQESAARQALGEQP